MRIFANSEKMSGSYVKEVLMKEKPFAHLCLQEIIENAQKRVEEQNFSSRKHLLEYDDVMSQQRQVIYATT